MLAMEYVLINDSGKRVSLAEHTDLVLYYNASKKEGFLLTYLTGGIIFARFVQRPAKLQDIVKRR